jgi:hypothetical protein
LTASPMRNVDRVAEVGVTTLLRWNVDRVVDVGR